MYKARPKFLPKLYRVKGLRKTISKNSACKAAMSTKTYEP